MKKVGFVILTWNSIKYIEKCFESILKVKKFEPIISVCDNGSTDGGLEVLKKYESEGKIILSSFDVNKGTTISRNEAIRKLPEVDYICILDSDTEILNEDEFYSMIEYLDNNLDIGIIGPKLENASGVMQYSGRNIPTSKEKLYKLIPLKSFKRKALEMEHIDYDIKGDVFCVGYLMSACWVMRYETFKQIGYLDENIFYAPEDTEYCLRAWSKGLKVAYFKKCKVLHHWQRISRKKIFSKHNFEHIKGLRYLKKKYKKEITRVNKLVNSNEV